MIDRVGSPRTNEAQISTGTVALAVGSLGVGGAERSTLAIARGLMERGHRVVVLVATDAERTMPSDDVAVVSLQLPTEMRARPVTVLRTVLAMRRRLRQVSVGVVVGFDRLSCIALRLACFGTSTTAMLAERTNPLALRDSRRTWLAVRLFYLGRPKVIVQTAGLAERLEVELKVRPVATIPNFLDSSRAMAIAAARRQSEIRGRTVTFLGRLARTKGVFDLIDAFAESLLAAEGWILDLVGDGPDFNELVAYATAELGESVRFWGATSEPEAAYAAAGIMVVPSHYEGYCNVLMEALVSGAPTVAAAFEFSSDELVTHGVNGMLVPVGDRRELARTLRLLADSPELRSSLGAAAAQTCLTTESEALDAWQAVLFGTT